MFYWKTLSLAHTIQRQMVTCLENCKMYEIKQSRHNLSLCSGIYLEQMRETPENLSEDNRRSRLSSNRAIPEYKTATFTVW